MHQLARMFWSWFLIRGIIAVLIGLLALFMPAATFTALVMLLGSIYAGHRAVLPLLLPLPSVMCMKTGAGYWPVV